MQKLFPAAVAALVLVVGCGQSEAPTDEVDSTAVDASAALATLFDEYFERNLEMNPVSASFVGDNRYFADVELVTTILPPSPCSSI